MESPRNLSGSNGINSEIPKVQDTSLEKNVVAEPAVEQVTESAAQNGQEKQTSVGGNESSTQLREVLTPQNSQVKVSTPKSEELQKIEKLLAEDLEDIYKDLPPELKIKFKEEGEKTARTIELLLHKTKINVKKLIKLITGWLKIIPGVNKFFLEQEAKIKADELITKFKDQ